MSSTPLFLPASATPCASFPRDTGSRLRGRRILYVDDDSALRRATCWLLGEAGAICLLAGTHEQAVTLVAADPELELAILDFQMPDGDVGGLVKRVRTARAVLPLLGTSAVDRQKEFADRGVSRFLEKPWRIEDLVNAVNW